MTFLDKSILKPKILYELKWLCFIFIYAIIMGLIRISVNEGELSCLTNGPTHFFIGLISFYMFSNIKDPKLLNKILNYF